MTAAAGDPLLRLDGLVTGHGGVPVVHGVDLTVGPGEVVALVGANGAGKTSTLLAVSALLPVMAGRVTVLGAEVGARTRPEVLARAGLAHVPEDRSLFGGLTGRENILLGLRGDDARRGRAAAAVDEALAPFPALTRIVDRPAGLMSGGEQQMLAIARALAGRPRLLLVDELSLGLAPIIVEVLLPALRAVARERDVGVLLVEQHVPLVLGVADRAVVLARGRVVAQGSADDLADDRSLLEASYLGDVG